MNPDQLIANILSILAWKRGDEFAKLQEPPRRWEWEMSPQTINAYYTSSGNEIVFPAAILQPPFFDPAADIAVNFGAIGMVIGHEIGHGFDDQGSRSDAEGRLRNWWSATSRNRFENKTERLATQYSRYEAMPELYVNGQLTLGENIGDLGGAQVSLIALKNYVADHPGQVPEQLDGFNPVQRYFLSFAQLWRAKYSPAFLRRQVLTDPHSPNEFRVNGVVPNLNEWYAAFSVKETDGLFKPEATRIHIW
ncbi:MAG: M13 family metallopeptidase [Pseudomonadota bacterium]|nr:M13 family metallopeptidase [Pseudomonadota bacterium]